MRNKRQNHDGIAGGLITLGVLLGVYVNPAWLWIPGTLGRTLLQSGPDSAQSMTSWTEPFRINNPTHPGLQYDR
jgi:hypothetical protein